VSVQLLADEAGFAAANLLLSVLLLADGAGFAAAKSP
jgi:hypothetical protein